MDNQKTVTCAPIRNMLEYMTMFHPYKSMYGLFGRLSNLKNYDMILDTICFCFTFVRLIFIFQLLYIIDHTSYFLHLNDKPEVKTFARCK